MSDQINDDSIVIGSRTLAIGSFPLASGAPTSPSNYATDDFSYDQASTETLQTDGNNIPTGRHVAKGPTTGTSTLQLADDSATVPTFGMCFVEDEGTFYITEVGRKEGKGAECKVPIKFCLAINDDDITVS